MHVRVRSWVGAVAQLWARVHVLVFDWERLPGTFSARSALCTVHGQLPMFPVFFVLLDLLEQSDMTDGLVPAVQVLHQIVESVQHAHQESCPRNGGQRQALSARSARDL